MMGKKRGRKYKQEHRRIEFVLNGEIERDQVIVEALDRMTRRGEASEFIKRTLYQSLTDEALPDHPATRDDLEQVRDALLDEIAQLREQITRMRVVAAPSNLPEMDQDDERKRKAADRLRKVSFKGLSE